MRVGIRGGTSRHFSCLPVANYDDANESLEKRYKGGESLEARGLSAVPEHASLAVILV